MLLENIFSIQKLGGCAMYAVMSATGNIGSKLANILLDKGEKVRVIGRSSQRLKPLLDQGAEAAVGDVSDATFLTNTFKGADAVFALIPPNYAADDFRAEYNAVGANIVKAIQDSGVKHVLFLSSVGADLPEKTGVIKGLRDVEQRLNKLEGVNILHLRPTYFMENLLANVGMIKNMGNMGSEIKGDVKFAMIATQDIAPVAADHLVKKDFSVKAIHELLGERDVSMYEVTKIFGEKIGKPDLQYLQFSAEDSKKVMMDSGISADVSDQLLELGQAINDGLIAVKQQRTAENTTSTSIEEFADFFAQVYEIS
ncbi:MAG: NmrA family NAD(P)-binding protein [Ignavibacteriaceae bacterium]|nr:NmrA family NAD(P)-binding protein [Ignavibacteriaceae bacterium]